MQTVKLSHFLSKPILFVLCFGICIVFTAFYITYEMDQKADRNNFHHLMQQQVFAIQRELDLNLEVVRSLKHFYDSSAYVTRAEFKNFVQESLQNYQSIQALEWIPKVTHKQREVFELQASLDLRQAYTFKQKQNDILVTSKKKEVYYPVYYLEPLKGNERVLGFDLGSSDIRMQSLEASANLNKMMASSKIRLIQEQSKDNMGFLVFNPVWNKDEPDKLLGFILGVFKVSDIISNALKYNMKDAKKLDIWLADVTFSRNKPDILFSNGDSNVDMTNIESKLINIDGRIWRLFAKPNQHFYNDHFHHFPIAVTLVVTLITLLVVYILALRVSKEDDLQQLVKDKTKTIQSANRKYESLLNMFDKKVIASKTDAQGLITYATQAFCDISGYSQEELIGNSHNIVRHPDMPTSLYEKMWETIQSGDTFYGEIKNKRKDGTYYWVDVQIEPDYDENYNIVGYTGIREDITAKKQIEEFNKTLANKIEEAVIENTKKDKLLLEQSKMAAMGEMIGAIAHQWRQPLNTLSLKIQFLEDDYEDKLIDETYLKEYSKESMKLIDFMSKTIDDFRNFFTIDKEKSRFYVREKIEETTGILEVQLQSHKIELKVMGEDFEYLGYPSEFQQVILNVVNNAKDALLENNIHDGFIHIRMSAEDKSITIEDNAQGIPSQVIDRIFEPYFTTKEQGKGTGLGLYMSKMIIEDNMHGSLSVQNINDGAQFTIMLGDINE